MLEAWAVTYEYVNFSKAKLQFSIVTTTNTRAQNSSGATTKTAMQSQILMRCDAVRRDATWCDAVYATATKRPTFKAELLWLHRPTFQGKGL